MRGGARTSGGVGVSLRDTCFGFWQVGRGVVPSECGPLRRLLLGQGGRDACARRGQVGGTRVPRGASLQAAAPRARPRGSGPWAPEPAGAGRGCGYLVQAGMGAGSEGTAFNRGWRQDPWEAGGMKGPGTPGAGGSNRL